MKILIRRGPTISPVAFSGNTGELLMDIEKNELYLVGSDSGVEQVVELGSDWTKNRHVKNIGDEKTCNKVTSIDSSSTNDQYPSAKCMYDTIGDIESLLENLL